jgi:hypothetical protein
LSLLEIDGKAVLDGIAAALDGGGIDEVEPAELVVGSVQSPGIERRAVPAFELVERASGHGHGMRGCRWTDAMHE